MQYSTLGDSGLVVSRVGFGAMTLGQAHHPIARFTAEEADGLVGQALDAGITLFDTADVYHAGESEALLGRALGARRDDAIIATKCGMRATAAPLDGGLSARHIRRSADGSHRRLGSDWIDLYQCHRPDLLVPLEETLAALDDLVRSGKVRYLGISNWPAWLAATAMEMQRANGWAPFVSGQMYYSLVMRDIEPEYVPMARRHGLGTLVWSPLSGGFLTGRYTRADASGSGGRLSQMNIIPPLRDGAFEILDVVTEVARDRGVAPASIALAWLLDRQAVDSVILGFSSVDQLQSNLTAVDLVLTDDEVAALDAVSATTPPYPQSWMPVFCSDPFTSPLLGARSNERRTPPQPFENRITDIMPTSSD